LCQAIIALMPPHDTYIETHLGGEAIMKRKPPARRNIGIDHHEGALAQFQCDYPVELVHGCAHPFLADFPAPVRPVSGLPDVLVIAAFHAEIMGGILRIGKLFTA
jgi:hypothetical protein